MRLVLVAVALLAFTVACNDTHHPRCNDVLTAQNAAINGHGWTLRCDPDAPDLRYDPPAWVQGFADPRLMVVALWPDRIPDDQVLFMVASHEWGHLIQHARGLTFPSQQAREVDASQRGWCRWGSDPFVAGVGMPGWGPPPGGCGALP